MCVCMCVCVKLHAFFRNLFYVRSTRSKNSLRKPPANRHYTLREREGGRRKSERAGGRANLNIRRSDRNVLQPLADYRQFATNVPPLIAKLREQSRRTIILFNSRRAFNANHLILTTYLHQCAPYIACIQQAKFSTERRQFTI